MARIPTAYSDLSRQPSLVSGRRIATYDTTAIGRGVEQLASGLSDVGSAIVAKQNETKQQQNAVDIARAEATKTEGLLNVQNQFENDPDYSTFNKRGNAEVDKAITKSAELIRDPKMRERYIATQQEQAVRAKDWLTDKSTDKRRSAETVAFDDALEKSRRLYVDPATPEDVRKKARADIEGAIKVGETTGLLTPEMAANRRLDYMEKADLNRGRLAVKQNPDVISKPLPATVAERSSRAMEYYMSRGWTKEQSAGIVGNLLHESGGKLDTGARNPGDGSDGSDSIGIGQWNSSRATALKKFAALNKADWRDYGIQLAFVDHELRSNEKAAGDNLKNAKTLQEANDAFIMYERPQGSDQGARNAHGYTSRLNYAAQAAGEDVNPDWYKRLPPEQQQALQDDADLERKQYAIQQTAETKIVQQQTKDAFSLQIATEPARVKQADILANPNIDNGDKAALINTLNAAQKENQGVNEFISAIGGGDTVSVNPFDGDQKKIADKAFDQMLGATTEDKRGLLASSFITQTGYIPDSVRSEIRRNMATTDVQTMATSLQTVDAIQRLAPTSMLAMEGHEQVEKNLTAYRHYAFDMGYSADEAARKVVALNDPAMIAQRDAIMKSKPIADAIKAVDANAVADLYDTAFSFQPNLGDAPTPQEVSVGYNPESEAVIVADYKSMLEEGVADAGGDLELGKKMADERFKRMYAPSTLTLAGDRSIVKLPPDKAYPADPNGSHDYIRQQALDDLKAEGINATDVFLQAYDQTERDVSAGKLPNYQLFYMQDGKLEKLPHPFIADPALANKTAVETSRVKQKENLGAMIETGKRLDAAGKRKEGSDDWIKAQEIENEYQRIQSEKLTGKPKVEQVTPDTGEMPATDAMGNPL